MTAIILDDDHLAARECKEIIAAHARDMGMELSVDEYHTPQELFTEEGRAAPAIAFLDILLPDGEEQGIEVGKQINEKWPECRIVYLTDYLMYATDVYSTRHTWFVLKSQLNERIDEVLARLMSELEMADRKLVFSNSAQRIVLAAKEVLYFERTLRLTRIIGSDREFTVYDRLSDIQSQVSPILFCRCHNSYLVNLEAVLEMNPTFFIMSNHVQVPISRQYRQSVRQQFFEWIERRG